jgi:hypothetical protein
VSKTWANLRSAWFNLGSTWAGIFRPAQPEILVEVRDDNFQRVGQIPAYNLPGAQFIIRYNNVGSWKLNLPYGDPLADLLRTPGYGVVVTGLDGEVLLSGPMLAAKLEQTPQYPEGLWIIEGADDSLLLSERLAYPDPAEADVTAQTQSHDRRTGEAETIMKAYVDANLGSTAPLARQISNLIVETDQSRGAVVNGAARFTELQTLLFGIAESTNLGYRLTQVDDDLVFSVFEPVDRSAFIRLDVRNNFLSSAEYGYLAPQLTRSIVGGQGEAVERLFIERSNSDSTTAETLWGRRIEVFTDARQAAATSELEQAGDEALADTGKTVVSVSVTPTDNENMKYGIDWNVGDVVSVVAGDTETVARVTEAGISIESDGVRFVATLGEPAPLDFETKLVSRVSDQEKRISSLERNTTGYGVNTVYQPEGGTDGTQPTFSGDAIFGSYNRVGNLVHFSILVDFDNITGFGTGQYYVTLPYPARVAYKFRDGCLHDDNTGITYHISGHVNANSDELWLFTTDVTGQRVSDFEFEQGEPITLTTADSFHIAGTYEIEG